MCRIFTAVVLALLASLEGGGVMLPGARILFAGKKSAPPPYDYEVAYIERDGSVLWAEAGMPSVGGFDISRYIPADTTFSTIPMPLALEWSFTPVAVGVIYGLWFYANAFVNFHMWKTSGQSVYQYTSSSINRTSVVGELEMIREQSVIPKGGGVYDLEMDGMLFKEYSSANTAIMREMVIMRGASTTTTYDWKYRIASFRFGDIVDLIPVVKGAAMGFYNKADGELFLAEQECLKAGPRV